MSKYEIYAVKYAGPLISSGAMLMWFKDWDITMERAYYIWCLKGPDHVVIVDAGVAPDLAKEKDIAGYENPVDVLDRIGVKAEDVQHVVLTHMHWDHANGVTLFPNARFYVQEEEYRFWTSSPLVQRPALKQLADDSAYAYLSSLEGTGRLILLNGDQDILPGIACLTAPGHTIGLQAVAVDTAKGRAILGSDCAHTFENYKQDWPSCLIFDLPAWMNSFDKLKKEVSDPSLLFPGHDILMARNFPIVAENVTRLV
jgi:glyoxylase-like metal-dependent hydrolase (beta-lactamase superfamily II)